jgi:hypothetical protein
MSKMSRDLLDSMDRFALEQIERAIGSRGLARQAVAGGRN